MEEARRALAELIGTAAFLSTAKVAAAHDGLRLEDVLELTNTTCDVVAYTAYRAATNEAMLSRRGFVSRIHHKKPRGRQMPEHVRIASSQKSKVRSAVEHVFAHQKGLIGLFVQTIGLARAQFKFWPANLAYNMRRFVYLSERYSAARGGQPESRRPPLPAGKNIRFSQSPSKEAHRSFRHLPAQNPSLWSWDNLWQVTGQCSLIRNSLPALGLAGEERS